MLGLNAKRIIGGVRLKLRGEPHYDNSFFGYGG